MEEQNFYTNWYEHWLNQCKEFFISADKNLKEIFTEEAFLHPEENLQRMRDWVRFLKSQWDIANLTNEQKTQLMYWQMLYQMYNNAADLLIDHWLKRTRENNPIKSTHELYELWLDCCREVYEQSLRSKAYQDAVSEFMNTMFKAWKTSIPR